MTMAQRPGGVDGTQHCSREIRITWTGQHRRRDDGSWIPDTPISRELLNAFVTMCNNVSDGEEKYWIEERERQA